jgi:hypothetical protein
MIAIGTATSQLITESRLIAILSQVLTEHSILPAVPSIVVPGGHIVLMCDLTNLSYRIPHVSTINLMEAKYPSVQRILVLPESSWTSDTNATLYQAIDATSPTSINFWIILLSRV